MKKFLAVFIGSETSINASNWEKLDENIRSQCEEAGMKAWGKWVSDNKDSIVELGAPLGPTKLINPKGISNTQNNLTAYTIVQAENHEDAAKLFINHPHFMIFPGDSVEVMECLPIPGT